MKTAADKVEAVKREYADWIKSQPGMSGVEFQPSRVLILTNGMTPETKAAIREKLHGVMPVEFYEIGPIKAQAAAVGPNDLPRQ
jgi:hypothetical protein